MLNENNSLVAARDSSEATLFTIQDANARISTGRKARYYSVVEANVEHVRPEEPTTKTEDVYRAPELDAFETPTLFDHLHNDWESMLADLCYMSDHIGEYQSNLNQMLSDVDKEICDIMHYI